MNSKLSGIKKCTKCKIEKELREFNKNISKKDGFANQCKECIKEYNKEYYQENSEKIKEYQKKYIQENSEKIKEYFQNNSEKIRIRQKKNQLMRSYNLTLQDYRNIRKAQKNRCKICNIWLKKGNGATPNVDHDHKTGKVRGILCHHCNVGIGHFKDNPEILQTAIKYLTNSVQ